MQTNPKCNLCGTVVWGYEHRIRFVLVDGERIKDGDYAALDCGCEVLSYEMEVKSDSENLSVKMVDSLRKTTILEFNDDGPVNRTWGEYDCY